MENTTKILLITVAVLIVIILIASAVLLFRNTDKIADEGRNNGEIMEEARESATRSIGVSLGGIDGGATKQGGDPRNSGNVNTVINDWEYDNWDGTTKEKLNIDENKNWHIYNCAQFKFFADFVNNKLSNEEMSGLEITEDTIVYLEKNLDLGAVTSNGGQGNYWESIGKENTFKGTFNGKNHTIAGIYIDEEDACTGLFAKANIVRNLTIKDSYIAGGKITGGIVGLANYVYNCTNDNTTVKQKNGNYADVRRNSRRNIY